MMIDERARIDTIGRLPVFGVCGWSGSGKTTLIEAVLPKLLARNLKVAVVKHDVHAIDVDRPGKDSDRFFQAGADVYLQGNEELSRRHPDAGERIVSIRPSSHLSIYCADRSTGPLRSRREAH